MGNLEDSFPLLKVDLDVHMGCGTRRQESRLFRAQGCGGNHWISQCSAWLGPGLLKEGHLRPWSLAEIYARGRWEGWVWSMERELLEGSPLWFSGEERG